MHDAATAYVLRYHWRDGGAHIINPEQLQEVIRNAYTAGYTEGRATCARKHEPV